MKKTATIVMTAFCLLISSCGGGFYMLKKDAKPEIAAPPDKAILVIYRGTSFGFAVKIDNFIDNKFVGQTQGKSYFVTEVEPGEHYVIGASENNSCAKINFEAGKVYYLLQAIYPGVMFARTGFEGSDPESFEKDLPSLSYFECCVEGKELPTMDEEDYRETVKDHEEELKKEPERHNDTNNLQGY